MKFTLPLVVLFSFFLGKCLLLHYFIPLFFLLIFAFIWLIFRYPEIALFIVILAANNFFSLVSDEIFRLPGIFRFKDLLFILSYLVLFFRVYQKKVILKQSLFSRNLWIILFFVTLEIVLTMFLKQQSFNYSIRMGRIYLYYLLYFPLVYLIDTDIKFKRFINLLLGGVVAYSLLIVVQYILGPSHVIFKFASHVEEQLIAGAYITRTYAAGASLVLIVFYFYLFYILMEKKYSWFNFFILILTFFSGVYLQFGRANLFGVITGFLFSVFILLNLRLKIRSFITTLILVSVIFFSIGAIKIITEKNMQNPIVHSFRFLLSGVDDMRYKTGTYGFRLQDSAERIELIQRSPIIGIGFVHPLSGIINIRTETTGIVTNDSGLITLLLNFGILGIFWLAVLTTTFYKKAKKLFFNVVGSKRALVIALFAYFFGRLFAFLTLADFVTQGGIVTLTIVFFILNYIENNKNGSIYNNS
jgi:hypothetical protein